MDYKTILVLCDSSTAAAPRITLARHIAERSGGHLIGLHIRPTFQPPIGFGVTGCFWAYEERTSADVERSTRTFQRIIGQQGPTTEWIVASGKVGGYATLQAVAQTRCVDLVVLGQTSPDPPIDGIPADLPEAIALWSGRPTLIVPYTGAPALPIKTAVVCWNGSREAALAASGAVPLLKLAADVIVLTIGSDASADPDAGSAADAVRWLLRHGVNARAEKRVADGEIGQAILSRATDLGADLIVMGAYGTPRMKELALGGATRTILRRMTVPVLFAH